MLACAVPATAQVPPYVSGGIGQAERAELSAVRNDFSLQLVFAARGTGHYLADVEVRIVDADNVQLLRAVSKGPFFYAQLAPARYTVHATYGEHTQSRTVTLRPRRPTVVHLYWNDTGA